MDVGSRAMQEQLPRIARVIPSGPPFNSNKLHPFLVSCTKIAAIELNISGLVSVFY